jgi:Spy/CpxP family protein refolding chaperone
MPNYKAVNEGVIDSVIQALFNKASKGMESATIRKLSKSDPELAQQFKDLQQTREKIKKTLTRKQRKQLSRNEIPDIIKNL